MNADVMLAPYVLMLQRLGAKLDSLPNVKKYAETVKVRTQISPQRVRQAHAPRAPETSSMMR